MNLDFQVSVPNILTIDVLDLIKKKYSDLTLKKQNELLEYHLSIYSYIKVQDTDEFGYSHISKSEFECIYKRIISKGNDITYRVILSNLSDMGYIKINDSYRFSDVEKHINLVSKDDIGFFSKSYKVIKYKSNLYDRHHINFYNDLRLVFKTKTESEWIKELPEYKVFIENTFKTTILLKKYKTYLDSCIGKTFVKDKSLLFKSDIVSFKYNTENILDERRVEQFLFEAFKINLGIIWFTVSNEGRLYTSFTNLSSTHIPFIRCKHCSNLIYLDAKNCQPLILSSMIKNDTFKRCVEDGTFYEKIAHELQLTRSKTKSIVYKDVLFNDSKQVSNKLKLVFDILFGEEVVSTINKLKSNKIYTITQRIESQIFIDNFKKFKGYILTRHDGIFIEEKNKELAIKMIKEGFLEYNLNVSIEEKNSLEYYESFKK